MTMPNVGPGMPGGPRPGMPTRPAGGLLARHFQMRGTGAQPGMGTMPGPMVNPPAPGGAGGMMQPQRPTPGLLGNVLKQRRGGAGPAY